MLVISYGLNLLSLPKPSALLLGDDTFWRQGRVERNQVVGGVSLKGLLGLWSCFPCSPPLLTTVSCAGSSALHLLQEILGCHKARVT